MPLLLCISQGMSNAQTSESFVPLRRAAVRLGVPAAWLREEAKAGRLPHLRVGRRLLFNPEVLELALIERARESKGGGDG